MELQTLYSYIADAYQRCKIRTLPVDCFAASAQAGYRIVRYSDLSQRKQRACWYLSGCAFTIDDVIYYEDLCRPENVRFFIAHELGHLFTENDDEDLADQFASHFLAPRILIHELRLRDPEEIELRCGLSRTAALRAFEDYERWFFDISHSRIRRPTDAELRLERYFFSAEAGKAAKRAAPAELSPRGASTAPPDSPRRRRIRHLQKKRAERTAFLDMLAAGDEDFRFRLAERQYFYGEGM